MKYKKIIITAVCLCAVLSGCSKADKSSSSSQTDTTTSATTTTTTATTTEADKTNSQENLLSSSQADTTTSTAGTTTLATTSEVDKTGSQENLLGKNDTQNLLLDVMTKYNISATTIQDDKLIIHQVDDTKKEDLMNYLKQNNVDMQIVEIGENMLYGIDTASKLLSNAETMKKYNISGMSITVDKMIIHQIDDTQKEALQDFLDENKISPEKVEIGDNQSIPENT